MTGQESDRRQTANILPIAGEDRRREKDAAQRREFQGALKAAEAATPLIEPSADEIKNGWTAESLSSYVAEQRASQELRVDPASAMNRQGRRPRRANSRYRPLRWRG